MSHSRITKMDQTLYEAAIYANANCLLYQQQQYQLPLSKDEIHIWCVPINKFLYQANSFSTSLSIDEKKRADRFYMELDRKRYIICRGVLRSLIGFYLAIEPDKLKFCYERFGKPVLASETSPKNLKFNMSHSDAMALYAFVIKGEVGIDVERIRDIPEMEQIVEQLFSEVEKKVFTTLPESRKQKFFFQIWTRKESLLKGLGEGFHQLSDQFDVLSETAVLPEAVSGDSQREIEWHIGDWPFSNDYAAAYSVTSPSRLCRYILECEN